MDPKNAKKIYRAAFLQVFLAVLEVRGSNPGLANIFILKFFSFSSVIFNWDSTSKTMPWHAPGNNPFGKIFDTLKYSKFENFQEFFPKWYLPEHAKAWSWNYYSDKRSHLSRKKIQKVKLARPGIEPRTPSIPPRNFVELDTILNLFFGVFWVQRNRTLLNSTLIQ